MKLDFGISTYIKAGFALAIVVAVGSLVWSYHSMSSDLAEAKASVTWLTDENTRLTDLANDNAAAAAKADADRRAAVDALESAQSGINANTKTSRLAESQIDAAPAADDGDVAPVLEALRKSRFGGVR